MVVYSKYITLKNGKRLYASQYGYKAFRFIVDDKKSTKKKRKK
jgi:hypothetical protein